MPLPKLEPNVATRVLLQRTEFSLDVLGRFACSTWDEGVHNGGAPFDCVVIGSGMYGAYAAAKLLRLDPQRQLRILVLEGGPFIISEHVQNLSRIGYGVFDPIYGKPYTSRVIRPDTGGASVPEPVENHYYCVGGKSLGWGKWCPRLTAADLAQWPADASSYLNANYAFAEEELGVTPATDLINGVLFEAIRARVNAIFGAVPNLQAPLDPPVAVQAQAPASGLFSFDAFSSLPLLIDAIREDISDHPSGLKPDSQRRLFLVPNARVEQLDYIGGFVRGVRVRYQGEVAPRTLAISPDCDVMLALSSMESTRLALRSFPLSSLGRPELMGRNLVAHLRSNFTCRIRREAIMAALPQILQTAALHVPGQIGNRRFHIQLFAAADPNFNGEAVLYRLLPDLDSLRDMLNSQAADFISFKVLTIGEMIGNSTAPLRTPGTSWMDLSPFETDIFGQPAAYAQWFLSPEEDTFWTAMDQAAVDLMRAIAGNAADIEFDNEPGFLPDPPANLARYRDSLGSTFHECGTLWMGDDPLTSVTDPNGRFHHVANAYCIDQAIFPTVGSANPVLTGVVNVRRAVEAIIARQNNQFLPAAPAEPGFQELLTPALEGWAITANGAMRPLMILDQPAIELIPQGNRGIAWYRPRTYRNFVLELEWKLLSGDGNAGVFFRIPPLDGFPEPAELQGYEVQLDDSGRAPNGTFGSPLHRTGAIYDLSPSRVLASAKSNRFNTLRVEAGGDRIVVSLNGKVVSELAGLPPGRRADGHIGLQFHTGVVQYRNVRVSG